MMGGLSSIGGAGNLGANPLSGLGASAGQPGMASLSGMGSDAGGLGVGVGGGGDQGTGGAAGGLGLAPAQSATASQGASFGDTLKSMVIDKPSASKAQASDLTARFAAGENIDPQTLAVASAKAGVEIQMATRTISSAVSAVRTLFQMQI